MNLDKKSRVKSYIYHGIVIFIRVFLSFFIEDLRVQNLNDHRKDKNLKNLRLTLDDDVNQINHLKEVLNKSVSYINQIQDNIDQNHSILNDSVNIIKLIDIEVDIYFFSKDGILSQAKLYSNMFQRQLKDLYDIYIGAIQLVNKEINISS